MRPTLFEIGGIEFPAYLTFIMVGFLAATYYARRRGESAGLDGVAIVDLGIWMLVAGITGARLLAVLTDGHLHDFVNLCTDPTLVDAADTQVRFCAQNSDCGFDYLCNADARDAVLSGARKTMCYPPRDCLATLKFWQGGLTFYGGLLLAVPVGLWFSRRKGLGALRMADIAAPAIMIGEAIGRLGCFFNGCCYGAETSSQLGVQFPNLVGPRHPTQLYESVFALVFFLVLHFGFRRRPQGQSFAIMLVGYGGYRLLAEFLRADPRGALGPLSTSQLISIPLLGLGVWLWIWSRKSKSPIAADSAPVDRAG